MGERTIRSGIGTYQRPDGQWTHGSLGDTVEVHEDDLERFDRLNPPEPEVVEHDVDSDADEDEVSATTAAELAEAVKAVEDEARKVAQAKADLDRERAEFEAAKVKAAANSDARTEEAASGLPEGDPAKGWTHEQIDEWARHQDPPVELKDDASKDVKLAAIQEYLDAKKS
jgi:hypothetical protein